MSSSHHSSLSLDMWFQPCVSK